MLGIVPWIDRLESSGTAVDAACVRVPAHEVHVRHRDALAATFSAMAVAAIACGAPTITTGPTDPQGPPTSPRAADLASELPRSPAEDVNGIDLFNTTYAPADGPNGGEVVIGAALEASQFNPFYINVTTEAAVASATWATLTVVTSDGRYAPDLAANIPTIANGGVRVPGEADDAMTVTWKLREGLRWSDGADLTCDDFKYAWKWVLDPGNAGVITAGWEDITAWDCPSPTVIVQHFKAIYEGYITLVLAPLPRHALHGIPVRDQVNGAGFRPDEIVRLPVSGAYAFDQVSTGAELRLVRNGHYKSWKTGQTAHLDGLIFKWYSDPAAIIAGYRAGEIDMAIGLNEGDIPMLAGLGDQVSAIPALTYEFLRPNWSDIGEFDPDRGLGGCSRNPDVADRGGGCPLADAALRRALAYAIDKDEINSRLLGGLGTVAGNGVTPAAWFYADQERVPYDPARARTILDEAGWTPGGDGVRVKNGLRAKIELCTLNTRPVRSDMLVLVGSQLRSLGIDSVINPVPVSHIFATLEESNAETPCALVRGNFDLALHSVASSIDPVGYYYSYHSTQFPPEGANDARVSDPEIDAALDGVRTSVDFKEIRRFMADFQANYVEKTVEIPLFYRKQVALHAPQLGNFVDNPTQAGPTWNVVDWYLRD
jgi:peptide/nickel transport system substrate-binding protein